MEESEFDKFADEYRALTSNSIRLWGDNASFYAEYKVKDAARSASGRPWKTGARVLDFGAGIGTSVPYLTKYFPGSELVCLDVSRKSLEVGESLYSSHARFVWFDGGDIPFDSKSFDLVFSACVFHHIEQAEHQRLLREMHRVLASGGLLMLFEHNPYNPLTVHVVNTCPFDENAVLIPAGTLRATVEEAGFSDVKRCYRLFFPRFMSVFRPLETFLCWLPMGAQYFVKGKKREGVGGG